MTMKGLPGKRDRRSLEREVGHGKRALYRPFCGNKKRGLKRNRRKIKGKKGKTLEVRKTTVSKSQ